MCNTPNPLSGVQILLVPNFLKDPTLDSVISMWDTPVYTHRSRNLSREETDEENV